MNNTTKLVRKYKKRETMEMLTEKELYLLRQLNLGYGNFISNARVAGIYPNTYRYILDRGYGEEHNIKKIRKMLRVHASYSY